MSSTPDGSEREALREWCLEQAEYNRQIGVDGQNGGFGRDEEVFALAENFARLAALLAVPREESRGGAGA